MKKYKNLLTEFVNKSPYQSRDLKKIILFGLISYNHDKGTNLDLLRVVVEIKNRKVHKNWCGGQAYLNSRSIVLELPRQYEDEKKTIKSIVQTIWHELYHCRGFNHGEFIYYEHPKVDESLRLRYKAVPKKREKKKTNNSKLENLLKRQKSWFTKKKRAETMLRKIAKSIKYYKNKMENKIK